MALPINIEDLLRKQKIEGSRIEFKAAGIPILSTIAFVLLPTTLIILVVVISLLVSKRKMVLPSVRSRAFPQMRSMVF